ncbi:hypothetical protein [Sphingomonas echinoides]|uniref:DUF883 domain-containing protein n=1 Tax=Sphingomonas echinoides TaxID=59803 RepID=A0ABU4PMK1_9SPHN|nr:hypothetical protein [Sphingomonas echinoides]MDX5985067.1 hypothetical protein [Sphingomonas echinoides]
MADDDIAPKPLVPTTVPLSPSTNLDLSWLPEDQRAALLTDYTRGMLDISKRAQELHVDVGALKSTLATLTETTRQVADDGNAVTVSHTQTSAVGRTEVIMGNTDNARTGKLSRSQTGETNWTPIYIIAGIIALVLIAAAFAR